MELYVIRHGETVFNINKIIQGQSDSELTDQGIAQAKKIAERLKDISFDKAYSSDLLRAKQTAKEVMEYHLNTPIEYLKDLREMSFGNLEGKSVAHLAEQFKKYGPFDRFTSLDTCETHLEMFTRINNFFAMLIKDYVCGLYSSDKVDVIKANSIEESNGSILNTMFKNGELTIKSTPEIKKKILVVTHGGWICNFMNVILWMKYWKILKEYSSRNTSLYIIRVYCRECNGVCALIPQSNMELESIGEDKSIEDNSNNTITITSNHCNHSMEISIDLLNDISHLSS